MKIAVTGKGGVGKTVLAALLARSLAERGLQVLAVDLDTNPGLALSLGLAPDDRPIPDEAVVESDAAPYGWTLAADLDPPEAVRRYAVVAGERVRFLGFGNIAAARHPLGRYLIAVRRIAEGLDEPGWVTVADLEAGPATPFEGFARSASVALVAVEATPPSIIAGRRILSILRHDGTPAAVVVNKTRGEDDIRMVADQLAVPLAAVPDDGTVRAAERRGSLAGLDHGSAALTAISALALRLLTLRESGGSLSRAGVSGQEVTSR